MPDLMSSTRLLTRSFAGRTASPLPVDQLTAEAQAALRQFSLERLMAYGVNHADAVELRGRVLAGEAWQSVAVDLARTCLTPAEAHVARESLTTRANRLYRASALLRMSQMMLLRDSPERRTIVIEAADLYTQAARITRDRRKLIVATGRGELSGWLYPAAEGDRIGCAVVIGGVEGWAMDFEPLGLALARRGVETLLLDGPGQGESRLVHGHYLTHAWQQSYAAVFDYLSEQTRGAPLAMIGNSMGGSVAMHLAATDSRISICCNNGGPREPVRARANHSFFTKMAAHCGAVDLDTAAEIWKTVDPNPVEGPVNCPLLIVHGGLDPLVSTAEATALFESATSVDKQMVVYSDGDHCVYNHQDDKHNLICDWVETRLRRDLPT
jgi:alpha-beta hydrolase superfamily lysophospholipase